MRYGPGAVRTIAEGAGGSGDGAAAATFAFFPRRDAVGSGAADGSAFSSWASARGRFSVAPRGRGGGGATGTPTARRTFAWRALFFPREA